MGQPIVLPPQQSPWQRMMPFIQNMIMQRSSQDFRKHQVADERGYQEEQLKGERKRRAEYKPKIIKVGGHDFWLDYQANAHYLKPQKDPQGSWGQPKKVVKDGKEVWASFNDVGETKVYAGITPVQSSDSVLNSLGLTKVGDAIVKAEDDKKGGVKITEQYKSSDVTIKDFTDEEGNVTRVLSSKDGKVIEKKELGNIGRSGKTGTTINLGPEKWDAKKDASAGGIRLNLANNKGDKKAYDSLGNRYNNLNSKNEVAYWNDRDWRLDKVDFFQLPHKAVQEGLTPKVIQDIANEKGIPVKQVLMDLGYIK